MRKFKRVLTPEEFMEEQGLEKNYELADATGLTACTMSQRRSRNRHMDQFRILEIGKGKYALATVGKTFTVK